MTLQQLNYLIAIAEFGSITEAAEHLYISQPTLSESIRNLEREMGISAFVRTKKGVVLTREGEELLSFARSTVEQADLMKQRFSRNETDKARFAVSTQHYDFSVRAFIQVVNNHDTSGFDYIFRDTETSEIIDDVASGRSELGVLYLASHNRDVLSKILQKKELVFREIATVSPHVLLSTDSPLADKDLIQVDDLLNYPYIVVEQREKNAFFFSEQYLPMLDFCKTVLVNDRATLQALISGMNGFTVSVDGNQEYGKNGIISKPLDYDCSIHVGIIQREKTNLSDYALEFRAALEDILIIEGQSLKK